MDFLIDFLLGNPGVRTAGMLKFDLDKSTGPPWKTFSRSSVSHEIFWDGSINVIFARKSLRNFGPK